MIIICVFVWWSFVLKVVHVGPRQAGAGELEALHDVRWKRPPTWNRLRCCCGMVAVEFDEGGVGTALTDAAPTISTNTRRISGRALGMVVRLGWLDNVEIST